MDGRHTSNVVVMLVMLSGYNIVEGDDAATHQFDISIDISGNEIDVIWTFNESVSIYGFKPMIYSSSDGTVQYESPMLHYSERYMKIGHEVDGKNDICVHVYKNSTHILTERCEEVKVANYKVVIGILAGVIFLIPCMAGLSYVIYQDYKRQDDVHYTEIHKEYTHKNGEVIPTSTVIPDELVLKVTIKETKKHIINGTENAAYVVDVNEYKQTNEKVEVGREAIEDRQDGQNSETMATVNSGAATNMDTNVKTDKAIIQNERL